MNTLRRIAFNALLAPYVAFQATAQYLGRNKLWKPVGVLLGLFATVAVVYALAPPELRAHINARETLHVGFGFGLYGLFGRLLLAFERKRGRNFGWIGWYFIPLVALLSINATNEWGFAMTAIPPDCANPGYWGGDWARAEGNWQLQLKSIADMAAWALGALLCGWRNYFCAEREWIARVDYIHRKATS